MECFNSEDRISADVPTFLLKPLFLLINGSMPQSPSEVSTCRSSRSFPSLPCLLLRSPQVRECGSSSADRETKVGRGREFIQCQQLCSLAQALWGHLPVCLEPEKPLQGTRAQFSTKKGVHIRVCALVFCYRWAELTDLTSDVGRVVGLHSLEGSLQPRHLVILLSHHAMLQERGKPS